MNFDRDWEQVEPSTPVLVGVGQAIERNGEGSSPVQLIARAGRKALHDADAAEPVQPDALVMVRLVFDTPVLLDEARTNADYLGQYRNPPGALAAALGLNPARRLYNEGGGGCSQRSINETAEMIARGEIRSALIAGGEALATQEARRRQGKKTWDDADTGSGEFEFSGELKPMMSEREVAHGFILPINTYPLFAQALRRRYGQTVQQHLEACAALFSPLSQVAADNPMAWFPKAHSAERLATVDDDNRWVGLPYPKYLNAIMRVNMTAAAVMCSWAEADRLGIDRDRRVFLHGCSQAYDSLEIAARPDFSRSPAIEFSGWQALQMAGIGTDELSFMDLYSCFPSAVQVACDALGLAQDDKRGLTISGGLPYFGGPGNNYSMHAVAGAVERLRRNPEQWALVTANGGYLTKHSMGIYSGRPFRGQWRAPDYAAVQRQVDEVPKPRVDAEFEGEVAVETWTVASGRQGPNLGLVVGRTADGRRVVAQVPGEDGALLQSMLSEEWLDRPGRVERRNGLSVFRPPN